MTYAVKVPFENGMLYVTEGNFNDLKVKTYEDLDHAIEARMLWGPKAQVVEYKEEDE